MITLRPYQERGIERVRQSHRAGYRMPLLVAPTGSGKTVKFSFIAGAASRKGFRVMIVAHRVELLSQTSRALRGFGIDHGVIAPGFTPDPSATVQVAGVQALASRMKRKRFETDLLILDEAHHVQTGNSWGRVYAGLGEPIGIGVTATPIRGDGKGLGIASGGIFDDIIDLVSVEELIEDGYLVRPTVFAPPPMIDTSNVRMRGGDFARDGLAEVSDKPAIIGDAVEHYQRICPGVPTIAFGVSIEHCRHIASAFQTAGFPFEVIDGSMGEDERKRLIGGLGRSILGLVSCDLIGEGVDIPAVGCAILMRRTRSLALHMQQMGRALRPVYGEGFDLSTVAGRRLALAAGGKTKAFIIDHVGNTMNPDLGFAETPHEWSLDGEVKPKRKGPQDPKLSVKQCDACYAVFRAGPVCPHCGAVQKTAGREINQVDGDLREISREEAKALAAQSKAAEKLRNDQARKAAYAEVQRARTIPALERIARERNYGPDWARHVFQSRERKAQQIADARAAAYGGR